MKHVRQAARARRRLIWLGLVAWLVPGVVFPASAERPLPDLETFRKEVRARLRADRSLETQYMYLEQREEIEVSPLGKVEVGSVKVYEVYPSLDPGNTWKRLIAVDGEPLEPEELAENDRQHLEDLRERRQASPAELKKRAREAAEQREKELAAIEDLFRLYDVRMIGREEVGGYPTILFTLDPKTDVSPRTEQGEMMQRVRVRAWVHEFDYELVRAEVEVLRDITWAWGLIGRVHAGSRALFERTKVNDEIWLPASLRFDASGRSLMFRAFDLDASTRWWGYRNCRLQIADCRLELQIDPIDD